MAKGCGCGMGSAAKLKPLRCAKKDYTLAFGDERTPAMVLGRRGNTLAKVKKAALREATARRQVVRVYAQCGSAGRKILMGTCTSTGCDMRRILRRR